MDRACRSMSTSASTLSPAASSAGERVGRRMRPTCSTPRSRRATGVAPADPTARFTTASEAPDPSRSATPNASPRQACFPRSAASAILSTHDRARVGTRNTTWRGDPRDASVSMVERSCALSVGRGSRRCRSRKRTPVVRRLAAADRIASGRRGPRIRVSTRWSGRMSFRRQSNIGLVSNTVHIYTRSIEFWPNWPVPHDAERKWRPVFYLHDIDEQSAVRFCVRHDTLRP